MSRKIITTKRLYHFFPIPMMLGQEGNGRVGFVLFFLLWFVPFALAFIWHRYHDHKHNHHLERKMDEVIDLLKKILDQGK